MIAELEAEVAAAVAAKEKELAAAQHSLDSAVGQRFAALERQLDAKVSGQWDGRIWGEEGEGGGEIALERQLDARVGEH